VKTRLRRLRDYVVSHVGRRSGLLLIFAITALFYGAGLLAGYEPTFNNALDLPVHLFGYMFIGAALIAFLGIIFRWSKVPYATSVAVAFFWAGLLAVFWANPFGWTAAMSWVGIALMCFYAATWPRVRRPGQRENKSTDADVMLCATVGFPSRSGS